jgi:hypothetical protein
MLGVFRGSILAFKHLVIFLWPGVQVPALNIFETSFRRGKFDGSRKLANGGMLEFSKIYPMDAVFDTPEDVPEEVRALVVCFCTPSVCCWWGSLSYGGVAGGGGGVWGGVVGGVGGGGGARRMVSGQGRTTGCNMTYGF